MAEVTGLRNDALPYPVYGVPYGLTFPILDNTGSLVSGAAGLDSERSLNGDTFADCTNEATEIATSSGMYYLLLTAAELTADALTIIVKTSTTDAKTTPMVLYPRKLPAIRSGTAQGGTSSTITLDSGASPIDNAYVGCLIVGTLDGTVEARICSAYVGSTKVATVVPDWVTTPDNNDTFVVQIPDGVQVQDSNLVAWLSVLPLALTSQLVQVSVGAMQAAVLTATAIASDAITAAKVAADVGTEIATAVWASGTRTLTSFGTLVSDVATAVWGAATRTLTAFGFSVTVATNNDKTGYTLSSAGNDAAADALLDRADAVEVGLTPRQEMRLTAAASAGVVAGAATTNVTIRNAVADSKVRIDATVDADGNRTAVTTDVT